MLFPIIGLIMAIIVDVAIHDATKPDHEKLKVKHEQVCP
jgi:hypothetical protein